MATEPHDKDHQADVYYLSVDRGTGSRDTEAIPAGPGTLGAALSALHALLHQDGPPMFSLVREGDRLTIQVMTEPSSSPPQVSPLVFLDWISDLTEVEDARSLTARIASDDGSEDCWTYRVHVSRFPLPEKGQRAVSALVIISLPMSDVPEVAARLARREATPG